MPPSQCLSCAPSARRLGLSSPTGRSPSPRYTPTPRLVGRWSRASPEKPCSRRRDLPHIGTIATRPRAIRTTFRESARRDTRGFPVWYFQHQSAPHLLDTSSSRRQLL